MIALTSKCYYADTGGEKKISCKGVKKNQNDLDWERYYNGLQAGIKAGTKEKLESSEIDTATNRGFRLDKKKIVTYKIEKFGLSAYYDKRKVHADGIHTSPIIECKKEENWF